MALRQFCILALCIAVTSMAAPTHASDGQSRPLSEALDELRSGAEALLRGLIDDIEPHLREIEPKADELGARLRDLANRLGGLGAYHPPEILPNGDILLRRRTPLIEDDTYIAPPDMDDENDSDAPEPDDDAEVLDDPLEL